MAGVDTELALVALAAMLSPTTVSFSVLALVLGDRPLRTGLWFYLGAVSAMLVIGVAAALVLGDAAAPASGSSGPKTWVAVLDVVLGAAGLVYGARLARRPGDPAREEEMVAKMAKVASSSAPAIFVAGATLANAGAFIPIALKNISEHDPTAAEYVAVWTAFTVLSLLPLGVALVLLLVARDPTEHALDGARGWLERHARTVGAILVLALGVALVRNGIAGLSG
jgi:hypothetical protein